MACPAPECGMHLIEHGDTIWRNGQIVRQRKVWICPNPACPNYLQAIERIVQVPLEHQRATVAHAQAQP